jgi:hypothetical protein
MTNGTGPQLERCKTCGGEYLLAFFRLRARSTESPTAVRGVPLLSDRCIGCETRIGGSRRISERLRRKAWSTRCRHGTRLEELKVIRCSDDLESLYGWSLERMMSDVVRVIEEGCPYCLLPFDKPIESDLGSITLDIRDPRQAPHYSTNVTWCCIRCNSEKQHSSLTIWGEKRSMWDRWHRQQALVDADPEKYGFLALEKEDEIAPKLW